MSVLKLIGLLAVGLLLFLAALMRLAEGKCDAFAEFKMFWRSRGRFDKVVLAALTSLMISFAGAKHGGTNGVEQAGGAATNEPPAMVMMSRRLGNPAPPAVPELPYEITPDALDIGLVLVGVGTGETHDFDAPASAASVTNWLAHGAATDYVTLRFDDFSFPFGTNAVGAVSALANGFVYPRHRLDGDVFPLVSEALFTVFHSPFGLGVVPVANWETLGQANRPSRVWYGYVEDGAFAVTWQNVLLGRDTASPVSFQLRLHPDGAVEYRYDLSRLADDSTLTNAAVAVANGGASFAPTPISRNLTSLKFARLTEEDRNNPDRDGDGLYTVDELFVHHTDPSLPDSDFDGLSDFDELFVHHTDPLDPNSLRADVPDGMAVVMGNEAPFAFPDGSTNTIFEHVFYTGTTNAPFAYPSDSDGVAVLKVTVRGSGAGRLVVGDLVVPLLARPRPPLLMGANGGDGDAPDPTEQTVSVRLPKGVRYKIWGELPPLLQAEVDSGSYTIGRLPRWYTAERGWVAFPNTKAKVPCIHDLGTGGVDVSLDPGAEITGLSCTWNEAANIEVENRPPLAARLTGRFPHSSTTPITYTLDHRDYLFGETTYTQTARFCPSHSDDDDDDDDDDDKIPPRPFDSEYGDDDEEHSYCSCWYGIPCGNPWCGCGCSCCGGDGDVDEETPLDVCQIHSCPYEQCEHLHREAYTNGISSVTNNMAGVLKLDRDPPCQDPILIRVPDTFVRCCPCPDHWTNYVALASKSYNLAVRTADGERFTKTVEDCTVYVSGLAPSFDFDDSVVSLCKTGVVYETHRYTVLGLKIDCPYFNIAMLNRANSDFGLPIVACTNKVYGTILRLRTDVDLPDGDIHIGFSDPTPGFRLYLGYPTDGTAIDGDGGELLVDSAAGGSFDVSLKQWKRVLRNRGNGREVTVTLVAEREGAANLEFGYVVERDGTYKGDFVTQRLTAIRSPLMADYNHNGEIDAADRELLRTGHPFRFWTNEDTVRGDQSLGNENEVPNAYDSFVNGKWDLVNFFPIAIDLSVLTNAWKASRVSYRIGGSSYGSSLNVTFADVPWNNLTSIQTNAVETVYGDSLYEASLASLNDGDVELTATELDGFSENSGAMIAESAWWDSDAVALKVYMDGAEVFRSQLPIFTTSVQYMYRWINDRDTNQVLRLTDLDVPYNAPYVQPGAKNLVMLHGANVSPVNAEKWGDYIFKRFWHAGFQGNYYFVSWWSDKGATGANYQENVSNAFVTASSIAGTVKAIPGDKVLMAHSLGNMVVSSMIEDHGLVPSAYIMCNSAVPIEAFDPGIEGTNVLVHSEWVDYPTNTWSKSWYSLFPANDARSKLTWRGRFPNVVQYAYNFYSTGDHCLELFRNNNPGIFDYEGDSSQAFEQYCWHKQDIWKGRASVTEGLGGTSWSGWGFAKNALGLRRYSVADAQAMSLTPDVLKTNTVFRINPQSMNTNVIERIVLDAHLAQGIPAWAPATGAVGYS